MGGLESVVLNIKLRRRQTLHYNKEYEEEEADFDLLQ